MMEVKISILLSYFIVVNCRDIFDTNSAKKEWQTLSQKAYDPSDEFNEEVIFRHPPPPPYMLHLYSKYAAHPDVHPADVRCITPCNTPSFSMYLEFCYNGKQSSGKIAKAELHLKSRKFIKNRNWDTNKIINVLLEVESSNMSSVLAMSLNSNNQKVSKHKVKWRKFDITRILTEANEIKRINVKFQEELNEAGSSEVKIVKPKSVLKMSELPFIVLFYENDIETEIEEDLNSENDEIESQTNHVRKKRFVSITPDLENHSRNYYAYAHDNIDDVDTQIVPMETIENGVDIDENNNGIDDIDEEEELLLDYEEDDMSEVEAKQHRFKVGKNQEEIPLPRRFSSIKRKERRRQHHNKRNRNGSNRRGTSGRRKLRKNNETSSDKWNTLPKIWKSFGRELGPGQSLSKTPSQMCNVQTLEVDMEHVGWGRRIISPKSFHANFCSGSCSFPLSQGENPTNHATVLSILARRQGMELPEPCCVPRKMESLTMLFFDEDGSVVLKTYPQMIVKSCGCR